MDAAPNAYTVDQFCNAYGVRRNKAYDEMNAGRLEFRKAGRKTLIRRIDADLWLDNLPKGEPKNDPITGE